MQYWYINTEYKNIIKTILQTNDNQIEYENQHANEYLNGGIDWLLAMFPIPMHICIYPQIHQSVSDPLSVQQEKGAVGSSSNGSSSAGPDLWSLNSELWTLNSEHSNSGSD